MKSLTSKVRAQPWLGTIVEISVRGPSEELCSDWITAAFAEIRKVHSLMSFHDEQSELSRLNHSAHLAGVECSKELCEVLRFAKHMYERTGGAVDISVAPTLVKQHFLPSHVQHESYGTPEDIIIEGNVVRFLKPLILDLGGVAKGYAVDLAIEKLKSLGCESASVNAGGDLRVFGESRQLYVRNDADLGVMNNMGDIADVAIATSAGYYSTQRDLVPYVNPVTRECLKTIPSVTVRAESCMMADALTKFVILKNPDSFGLRSFHADAWVQA